jgi:excisionase family DNA binding protein
MGKQPVVAVYLTAAEVGKRLGINVNTVREWARDRGLPAIRLGPGTIRFREDELAAWIERQRRKEEST